MLTLSFIYLFADPNGSIVLGPPPTVSSGSYPAQNAQSQRICRQCGLPGRYKGGECVEEWGPGPEGQGTVCDRFVHSISAPSQIPANPFFSFPFRFRSLSTYPFRCRKKMKRVVRRGTLDSWHSHSNQNSMASISAHPPPVPVSTDASSHKSHFGMSVRGSQHSIGSDRSVHRSDTLPARHHPMSSRSGGGGGGGGGGFVPAGTHLISVNQHHRYHEEHAHHYHPLRLLLLLLYMIEFHMTHGRPLHYRV
jgi:hypothetical protein